MTLAAIADAVRDGRTTALAETRRAIAGIRAGNDRINAVTRLLDDRALAAAHAVDAIVAAGGDPGPLAGVPFAVKDLFDVAGRPTTAGSRLLAEAPPAGRDAEAVARLSAAGAVLVATCNMDEFAYGFVTVNAHHGTTRNPHDPERLAGGSSGGSAAAVAGGMVPLSLGSDTNGSIRVPAALTGLYGLKPTHGAMPMQGVYPFVESFDDIGPFATSIADLRLACDVLREAPYGPPPGNRAAILGGWFATDLVPDLAAGIARAAAVLGAGETIDVADTAKARSAAYVMTACEGGGLHLATLRTHARDYDPATRDRLLAGALMPAAAYLEAVAFRARHAETWRHATGGYDVLIAPCVGDVAPTIADPTMIAGGERVPARAHLGMFSQPLSFLGLPVIAAPLKRPGRLPLGLQLVGRPGGEAALFAAAARLEAAGVTGVSPPPLPGHAHPLS